MKKIILLLLMTMVITAGFISCGSSEKKNEIPVMEKPGEPAAAVPASSAEDALKAAVKTKYLSTVQNIRTIANAVSGYVTDNYKAPEGGSITDVRNAVEPFYIRGFPLQDAWGNDFYYSKNGEDYMIASAGSDGIFKGFDQRGEYETMEGQDIIYSSQESFVFGPSTDLQKTGGIEQLLK